MAKGALKNWTILNYANGNNEYEPDMYKALIDSQRIGSNENINIVIQLAREERELARLIRGEEILPDCDDEWTGAKRYYVSKSKPELVDELGKINMADPRNFYEFIKWGIQNYPAKHYMLILGGHGASIIGTLTDYSQNVPYIMGSVEMCKAINMILKDTGCKIDILVLDICYMNLIEIIYELGREKNNTVKNILTYIETGPVEGLPMDSIISLINDNNLMDGDFIIREIVNKMDLNLVGIEINHSKLKKIKKASNDLAYSYLINKGSRKIKPFDLLTSLNSNNPWYNQVIELQKGLSSVVFCYNKPDTNKGNLINIMYMELQGLINIYYKFSFAKSNYWTYLLNDKELGDKLNLNVKEDFKPIVIKPEGICSLIKVMNPQLNENEIQNIFNKLVENRKWKWESINSEIDKR